LTNGATVLEKFGAKGTYYVAMGLMETTNDLGEQFRHDDLRSVLQRGHELASHTFSHSSARKVPCDVFEKDVENGERAIQDTLHDVQSHNFAYPYGAVTLTIKRKVGAQMRSCRGTCPGLNGPEIDLSLLRANSLYGDIDQAETARKLIVENERHGKWLIFYTHDVSTNPSRYGCTGALLEAVVAFAAHRGTRILTVDDVLTEIGHPRDGQTTEDAMSENVHTPEIIVSRDERSSGEKTAPSLTTNQPTNPNTR
jgi:peptidoglycan/xylan/chitin deacetylase (PgdA/CDA1 family)